MIRFIVIVAEIPETTATSRQSEPETTRAMSAIAELLVVYADDISLIFHCYRPLQLLEILSASQSCMPASLILRTFLQCFDTVVWMIWPVNTLPQYDLCVWCDVKPYSIQSKPATQQQNHLCKHGNCVCLEWSCDTMGSGSSAPEDACSAPTDNYMDTREQRLEWKIRIMTMRYKVDFEIEVTNIVYITFALCQGLHRRRFKKIMYVSAGVIHCTRKTVWQWVALFI